MRFNTIYNRYYFITQRERYIESWRSEGYHIDGYSY